MQAILEFGLGLLAGILLTVPVALLFARGARRRALEGERRARQAAHLAEVGTLTGGLAHEIRNPLSTLTLNLQLLREDLERPGSAWVKPGQAADTHLIARLSTLQEEALRLQTILDDFLRFAGRHEIRPVVQPIGPIIEDAAAFYRDRLLRSGIQVRTGLPGDLPPAAVDADLLKQAVSNLILNAEAAMPNGGELLITAERERRSLCLHVTDTGTGIKPEDLDKIFAPYYSTRPGGTGLGLPTVRRIIQEHQGTIEVHSEPGRGTRFTIRLPAADAS